MMKSTLLAAVSLVLASGVGAAHSQQSVPQDAQPLGSSELRELYSDRTWEWEDGAAYFAPDGDFQAVTAGGDTEATGSWNTRSGGRVCFRGIWRSEGSEEDLTHCFEHVAADGKIWQRRATPGAAWTVFRSADDDANEVYASFEQGDRVAAE